MVDWGWGSGEWNSSMALSLNLEKLDTGFITPCWGQGQILPGNI